MTTAMVALKPANITYEEAAALPIGAITALRLLRKGNTLANVRGQKVVIYGASGSVGTYAVQLAKYFGADVTGDCGTSNIEMVRSLRADQVLDYTKEDFSSSEEQYDTIFDTVGEFAKSKYSKILAPEAACVTMTKLDSKENIENLRFIKELIEAGGLKVVIDRCYPLECIVDAHRYVDAGHKRKCCHHDRTQRSQTSIDRSLNPTSRWPIKLGSKAIWISSGWIGLME